MSVSQECPICKIRCSLKNNKCKCGEDLKKARRSKRVKFYVYYTIKGKQYLECYQYSLDKAKAADGKIKGLKKEGRILDIIPEAKITFQELTDWYIALRSVQKLKSLKRLRGALKNFNKVFGNINVSEIKPYQLEEYQESRLDSGMSKASVDMEIRIAQTAVSKGLDNDIITSEGLLRSFRKIKRKLKPNSNKRDRILSPDEFDELIMHLPEHLKPIIACGYYTGMRFGEITQMTWDRTNLKKRFFELEEEHTKDSDKRIVLICDDLYKYIKDLNVKSDFVFIYDGHPVVDIRKGLKNACKKAGIIYGRDKKNGFIFHDLRHTFNTNMRKAGVPESVIMEITGHSTREMFDRYNTIDFEDLKNATEKLKGYLSDK
ncbi:MAG: site-specific integrase [Deltaproteobacteria bacterium]|nr:site-specific integrase [Deltaproteobacteria bacterium]